MCSKILNVVPTLTDSLVRIEDQGGATANPISSNGCLVFQAYPNFTNTVRPKVAGELFQNINGKLTSLTTVPLHPNFPIIESAAASPDYQTFAIAFSNDTSNAQLSIYNSNLLLRGDITIPNYVPGSLTLILGTFSPDSRYVTISYVVGKIPGGNLISNLDLYDTQNLQLVARTQFNGTSNGGQLFDFKCQLYLAIGIGGILSDDLTTFIGPNSLNIYLITTGTFNLVSSQLVPQFPRGISVNLPCDRYVLIGIVTRLATQAGNPSIISNPQDYLTTLPGDTRNLRIYNFDGTKLVLFTATDTKTDSNGLAWISGTDIIFVSLRTLTATLFGFGNFYQVVATEKCQCFGTLINVNSTLVTPPLSFAPWISLDGRWLLISGADNNNGSLPTYNNINLYHLDAKCIKYQKIKNEC